MENENVEKGAEGERVCVLAIEETEMDRCERQRERDGKGGTVEHNRTQTHETWIGEIAR